MINEETRNKLRGFCKGNLSHAYLICGASGIGKKTLAKDMAKTLLCEKKDAFPCGVCRSCTSFDAGSHPDISVLSPSGAADIISVKEIRALKETCSVKPITGDRRAVIINRAERMNTNAQNAFLKLLEEPAEGTVFVLLCSNSAAVLPTVRSRCVIVNVLPAAEYEIEKEILHYENASFPVTAAQAAAYSDGIIGKALDLMAADEKHPYFTVRRIMDALCSDDMPNLLSCMALITDKRTLYETAEGLSVFCLDVLACLSGADRCHFPFQDIKEAQRKLTKSKALNIIEIARQSAEEAEVSAGDVKFLAQKLILACREEIN